MKSTYTTIEGDLPRDVFSLNEAQKKVSDETLDETIDHAIVNGYFLADIEDHESFGVQYTLEKLEVEG